MTFQAIRDRKGLTWDIYQEGLDAWRRAKEIKIPSNPDSNPTSTIIGYTGQSRLVIDLVQRGENRVHREWTCRWGFGLYVTDHPGMYVRFTISTFLVIAQSFPYSAKFYSDQERREGRESWVYAVCVRDYAMWMKVSKVWYCLLHIHSF